VAWSRVAHIQASSSSSVENPSFVSISPKTGILEQVSDLPLFLRQILSLNSEVEVVSGGAFVGFAVQVAGNGCNFVEVEVP
jgi:hypothetical protein